jgi:hypothetical protein
VKVAAQGGGPHTPSMAVPNKRGLRYCTILALALSAAASCARADEIRLKDGKKLYGVIVAYEDNMFKVKTDFGYVLVEKDKIASIIPSAPAESAKKDPAAGPKTEPAVATSKDSSPTPTNASEKSVKPEPPSEREKGAARLANADVKPEIPASGPRESAVPPSIKASAGAPTAALAIPAEAKEPEAPVNREEVQGNTYTNYTHGFRMYKAPSWELLEDARKALPNAIVAMGTSNESTLLVIGQEKMKEPLDAAANTVEARLRDVYDNYHKVSRQKTAVGGSPAVEFHYNGEADDHLWSGTLVVISRGPDIVTVLGMTYADTDLIQIQENVIARAIASLEFNVR